MADAAAIAATYGSISAVTFVTATSYLDGLGIEWSGHFVAAMALMESPAIMLGIALYRLHGGVPAAMRLALPQANPSVYLPMTLAITFPFNLLIGIPLYHFVLRTLLEVS